MKLKNGDIIKHTDGTLYLCTVDKSGYLRYATDLDCFETAMAREYFEKAQAGAYDDVLINTGINVLDILRKTV